VWDKNTLHNFPVPKYFKPALVDKHSKASMPWTKYRDRRFESCSRHGYISAFVCVCFVLPV